MGDIRDKLLPVFFDEAAGHLKTIEECLAGFGPDELDPRALEAAFRAAHSIKGTAGLVKLPVISAVALRLEDALETLLENGSPPSTGTAEGLRQACARLKGLTHSAVKGIAEKPEILLEIDRLLRPQQDGAPPFLAGEASLAPTDNPDDLAAAQSAESESRAHLAWCVFRAAGRTFHLPIEDMVEISDLPPVYYLPLAPEYIRGLANLRGEVLPVVDLGRLYGLESGGEEIRLVVAQALGERLGFLAEGLPNLAADSGGERLDVPEFLRQYGVKPL